MDDGGIKIMNTICWVLIAIVIVVGFGVYLGIRLETKQ